MRANTSNIFYSLLVNWICAKEMCLYVRAQRIPLKSKISVFAIRCIRAFVVYLFCRELRSANDVVDAREVFDAHKHYKHGK